MLPILAASGALDGVIKILVRAGILAITAIGSFFLIKKVVKKAKYTNEIKRVGDDSRLGKANAFARSLYSAFFPMGEIMSDIFGDGTDEDLIFEIAADMYRNRINFSDVSNAYKSLYNRKLLQDLQGELDPRQYAKFNDIIQGGKLNGIGFNERIITRRATYLYAGATMRAVGKAERGIQLGTMIDAKVNHLNGKMFYGFFRDNKKMYVPANAVIASRKKVA